MSEQVDNQHLLRAIRGLERRIDELTAIVKKDKISEVWIDEDTAATMIGIAPRTLRRQCKDGEVNIGYRNKNGRNYHYSRKDLIKYQQQTSTSI